MRHIVNYATRRVWELRETQFGIINIMPNLGEFQSNSIPEHIIVQHHFFQRVRPVLSIAFFLGFQFSVGLASTTTVFSL
jgi:hypothetical protein